jgi:hypothetical protein
MDIRRPREENEIKPGNLCHIYHKFSGERKPTLISEKLASITDRVKIQI